MSCSCIRPPASLTGEPKTEDVSCSDACTGTKTPSRLCRRETGTRIQISIITISCSGAERWKYCIGQVHWVGTQLLSPSMAPVSCPSKPALDRRPADPVKVQSPRASTSLTRKCSRFDGFCKSGTAFGFVISLIKFILFCQYGRSNGRSCIKSIWVKD